MLENDILSNWAFYISLFAFLVSIVFLISNIESLLKRREISLLLALIFLLQVFLFFLHNVIRQFVNAGLSFGTWFDTLNVLLEEYSVSRGLVFLYLWITLIILKARMHWYWKVVLFIGSCTMYGVYFSEVILGIDILIDLEIILGLPLRHLDLSSPIGITIWTIGILSISSIAMIIALPVIRRARHFEYLFKVRLLIWANLTLIFSIILQMNVQDFSLLDLTLNEFQQLNILTFPFLTAMSTSYDIFQFVLVIISFFLFFHFISITTPLHKRYQRLMSTKLNYQTLHLLAHLCSDAYTPFNEYPKHNQGLKVVQHIENKKTDTVLNILNKGSSYYIIFQGSTSAKNIVTDLHPFRVTFPKGSKGILKPKVNKGFFDSYSSIREELFELLKAKLSRSSRVFVSGHSLGGSLAVLAAYDISVHFKSKVTMYNFGALRTGNLIFTLKYMYQVPDSYRVVNNEDFAPKVKFVGHRHIGQTVFLRPPDKIWVRPGLFILFREMIDDWYGYITGKAFWDHLTRRYIEIIDEITQGRH